MEILLHHVSYSDVYFHIQEGDTIRRERARGEWLEPLCRKVLEFVDTAEGGNRKGVLIPLKVSEERKDHQRRRRHKGTGRGSNNKQAHAREDSGPPGSTPSKKTKATSSPTSPTAAGTDALLLEDLCLPKSRGGSDTGTSGTAQPSPKNHGNSPKNQCGTLERATSSTAGGPSGDGPAAGGVVAAVSSSTNSGAATYAVVSTPSKNGGMFSPRMVGSPRASDLNTAEMNRICGGFDLTGIENSKECFNICANAFYSGDRVKMKRAKLVAVVFPIFTLCLDCWLQSILLRRRGCELLKIYFLSGSHEKLKRSHETLSTDHAARCLMRFAMHQLQTRFVNITGDSWKPEEGGKLVSNGHVSLRCVHSGPGVFLYDENIRFMKGSFLPYLDRDMERTLQMKSSGEDWAQDFSLSFILAEGAPARISAITQSLHQFKPNYIHILRPKSYREEDFLRMDGVQFLRAEKASVEPPMRVGSGKYTGIAELDRRIGLIVKEMLVHKKRVETASTDELAKFWLRKTKKPVLCVLMVQKPDQKQPTFFRGINLEVSMPTGSLCAERNCIGSAVAQDPTIKRADCKMIAVLSLPAIGRPKEEPSLSSPIVGSGENHSALHRHSKDTGPVPPPSTSTVLQRHASDSGVEMKTGHDKSGHDRTDILKRSNKTVDEEGMGSKGSISPKEAKPSKTGTGSPRDDDACKWLEPIDCVLFNDDESDHEEVTRIASFAFVGDAIDDDHQTAPLMVSTSGQANTPVTQIAPLPQIETPNFSRASDPHLCPPVTGWITATNSLQSSSSYSGQQSSNPTPAGIQQHVAFPAEVKFANGDRNGNVGESVFLPMNGSGDKPLDKLGNNDRIGNNIDKLGTSDRPVGSERPNGSERLSANASVTPQTSTSPKPGRQSKPTRLHHSLTGVPAAKKTELNPIAPCGACMEWIKKIAEQEPLFRIVTFESYACENIFVKRVQS